MSESSREAVLVVLSGRPGTGKTTIGRSLARTLRAAYLRTDRIAGPMLVDGLTEDKARAGHVAYNVAREIAIDSLHANVPVVVDGVHATHERRALWRDVSEKTHCRLIQFEMSLADAEHRRRVERRQSEGYIGPDWEHVLSMEYDDWSEARDGRRMIVETLDTDAALSQCLAHVRGADRV
jgi:predicted kinase